MLNLGLFVKPSFASGWFGSSVQHPRSRESLDHAAIRFGFGSLKDAFLVYVRGRSELSAHVGCQMSSNTTLVSQLDNKITTTIIT